MAIPWKQRTILTTPAGQSIDQTNTIVTGDGYELFEPGPIPASTTVEIDLSIPFAKIVAYCLKTDKNVTLKTNSSDAPDETISLNAGVAQFYPGEDNLFGHDLTKIFVVNGTGAVANPVFEFEADTTA